jgi:glycosyltransferase involved in cell wall biosynthesis
MKLLFLLKKQTGYGQYSYSQTSGLYNSAKFVVDMLNGSGVQAKLVEVVDNNSIDAEVHKYKPDVVIIEALWVVPEKFDVLKKLHPQVEWIVRLHSDLPFLATEGIATQWIFGYLARGIEVAPNSPRLARDLFEITGDENILLLPNYYPVQNIKHKCTGDLNVGCFGALRPMKNQLLQAVAAIRYANEHDRTLFFHINGGRCEQGGESVLKNLRSLFANTGHFLIEHPWLKRSAFLKILSEMNFALAASFSETFCITAADAVSTNTPLVCTSEVPWASDLSVVLATDVRAIVRKMNFLSSPARYIANALNRHNLKAYSENSKDIWLSTFPA